MILDLQKRIYVFKAVEAKTRVGVLIILLDLFRRNYVSVINVCLVANFDMIVHLFVSLCTL